MKRHEFITSLGSAAAVFPLTVAAQQLATPWRIGFLTPRPHPIPPTRDNSSDAFIDGMSRLGYSEGRNLIIEWRYADGDYTRLNATALSRYDAAPVGCGDCP